MTSITKKDKKLYSNLIAEMLHDYMVEDYTQAKIAEKYNLSAGTVNNIFQEKEFKKAKLKFEKKIIDKSVDQLSSRHASMLSRLTHIMEAQVDRIQKMQQRDKEKILDPSRMKEVLTAFALIAKEHRLDNDKPTDNQVMTIKVDMGPGIPLITENHIINAKPDIEIDISNQEDKPIIESSAVEEAMEVIVDNQDEDDMVFGSIE